MCTSDIIKHDSGYEANLELTDLTFFEKCSINYFLDDGLVVLTLTDMSGETSEIRIKPGQFLEIGKILNRAETIVDQCEQLETGKILNRDENIVDKLNTGEPLIGYIRRTTPNVSSL